MVVMCAAEMNTESAPVAMSEAMAMTAMAMPVTVPMSVAVPMSMLRSCHAYRQKNSKRSNCHYAEWFDHLSNSSSG
jgi:hypothetical protein